jgi:hypothetical protein
MVSYVNLKSRVKTLFLQRENLCTAKIREIFVSTRRKKREFDAGNETFLIYTSFAWSSGSGGGFGRRAGRVGGGAV